MGRKTEKVMQTAASFLTKTSKHRAEAQAAVYCVSCSLLCVLQSIVCPAVYCVFCNLLCVLHSIVCPAV